MKSNTKVEMTPPLYRHDIYMTAGPNLEAGRLAFNFVTDNAYQFADAQNINTELSRLGYTSNVNQYLQVSGWAIMNDVFYAYIGVGATPTYSTLIGYTQGSAGIGAVATGVLDDFTVIADKITKIL